MARYESAEKRQLLEAEWESFKKALELVKRRVDVDQFEILRDRGATELILKLADEKSNGNASNLGLEISQIASLYKLEWVFDTYKEIQRLDKSWWSGGEFLNYDLSVNEDIAEQYIKGRSEIEFTKRQKILIKYAEKVARLMNTMQKELKDDGAPSLPIGNIVSVKHGNKVEVNVPFIKQVIR